MSVETFLQEAEDLFESLEATLLQLEENLGATELVDQAFRALHTLKGSGAMSGFDAMSSFAHELEAAFEGVRSGNRPMCKGLVELALQSVDIMQAHLEGPLDAHNAAKELSLRTGLSAILDGKIAASSDEVLNHFVVSLAMEELTARFDPLELMRKLRELGQLTIETEVPKLSLLDGGSPTACHFSWEAHLSTDRQEDAIHEALADVPPYCGVTVQSVGEVFDGTQKTAPAASGARQATEGEATKKRETIKVDVEKLDKLLDLVGELVIAQSRLAQVAQETAKPTLRSIAEDVERLSDELRDHSMNLRMQPIGGLFQRYRRLIRDLGSQLGRKLEYVTEGDETEVDKTVLDRLGDCMIHLVRNAADHGIEPPEERAAGGKPEEGRIKLAASHGEGCVVIDIVDDGKGIDRDKVLARAIDRGLVEDGTALNDEQVYQLIFEPGFSTAETVSSVSGRGVGMDVVRRGIEALGGKIRISSELGRGTTFSIRIPLTLAIVDGLLVRLGTDPFVVPLATVEECIEAPARSKSGSRQQLAEVRGELVPYLNLREWFDIAGEPEGPQQVVIANYDGRRFGFVVDNVIGQHQTVLKQMGPMTKVRGLSGSTILGDGTVALILDGPAIMSESQEAALAAYN